MGGGRQLYSLIPKEAAPPLRTPLKGSPLSHDYVVPALPEGEPSLTLPGDAFMANPWSRLHGGKASLDPPPYPLPCTYYAKEGSRPAWEGDGFI